MVLTLLEGRGTRPEGPGAEHPGGHRLNNCTWSALGTIPLHRRPHFLQLDNGVHCLLPQVCSLGTRPSLPRAVVTLVLPAAPAVVLHRLSCPDTEMN